MNAYYEMFLRNWQIKIGKLAGIKKVSCDAGSHFDVNFSQKPVKPVSLFYVLFVILFLALRLYAFYFSRNFTSFLTRQLLKSASHANKWHRSQFLFQYITERKIFPRGKNLPTRFIILSSTDIYQLSLPTSDARLTLKRLNTRQTMKKSFGLSVIVLMIAIHFTAQLV